MSKIEILLVGLFSGLAGFGIVFPILAAILLFLRG
jgi:hypothetical protein